MAGIFLDSGNFEQVRKYYEMGVIRGVTTNPTILSKEGIAQDMNAYKECCIKIAKLIDPLPVSVEVTNNDFNEMRKQVIEFSKWARNINVKIPIHGPEGELENLKLIHEVATQQKIAINVTAMMSAQQGFLAAMAGATFVSLFGGRIQDMGHDACREIHLLRQLLGDFSLKSQIIAGSVRETSNIIQWFEAGAHIVTSPPKFVEGMVTHPYSKLTVQQFVRDGARFEK